MDMRYQPSPEYHPPRYERQQQPSMPPTPPPTPSPPSQSREMSCRAARELETYVLGPQDDDGQQTDRTRGATARFQQGLGQGQGLLNIMAARECIGFAPFNQHAPHQSVPNLPTFPASDLATPTLYAGACADEHSSLWHLTVEKEHRGPADAGEFGNFT